MCQRWMTRCPVAEPQWRSGAKFPEAVNQRVKRVLITFLLQTYFDNFIRTGCVTAITRLPGSAEVIDTTHLLSLSRGSVKFTVLVYYSVNNWGSRARAQGQLPPAPTYETRKGDIVFHATQHLCCQCVTIILKS